MFYLRIVSAGCFVGGSALTIVATGIGDRVMDGVFWSCLVLGEYVSHAIS